MIKEKKGNLPPYSDSDSDSDSDATWSDYKFLIAYENFKTFTLLLFGGVIFATLMVVIWAKMTNIGYAREAVSLIAITCPFLFCFITSKITKSSNWLWAPLLGTVCVAMLNETSGIFGGRGLKEISLSIYILLLICISSYFQFSSYWSVYKEKLGFTNTLFIVVAFILILLSLAFFNNGYLLLIAIYLPFFNKKQASLFSIPAHLIFVITIISMNDDIEAFVLGVSITYIVILLQIAYIAIKSKFG